MLSPAAFSAPNVLTLGSLANSTASVCTFFQPAISISFLLRTSCAGTDGTPYSSTRSWSSCTSFKKSIFASVCLKNDVSIGPASPRSLLMRSLNTLCTATLLLKPNRSFNVSNILLIASTKRFHGVPSLAANSFSAFIAQYSDGFRY